MVRGGASLVKREPVFSGDGKRLLVCTACSVSVYSAATGLLVTQLRGHTGAVTSVVVVPVASLSHAWTASQDGTIRLWDYSTGALLRTVDVGHPVHSMVVPDLRKPGAAGKSDGKLRNLVAFLSVSWSKEERKEEPDWRVVCHNLTTGKALSGHLAKMHLPQGLYVSPGGGLVGMLDTRKIWVWKVPQGTIEGASSIQCTMLHHTRALTVLAFDTTETRVAGGDQSGRILLWENVGERRFAAMSEGRGRVPGAKGLTSQKITSGDMEVGGGVRGNDDAGAMTTYHWHSHEVKFLLFSSDGVYLLSGGLEGVLVIWQLETGKRQFLPRLGGPVVSIAASPNPSLFAITCMDNAVKLVNIGTMEIERSIQGIKPPFPLPKELTAHAPMASIEPSEGKMVLPTHNLSLQFYDAASDLHVTEVQVTPRNFVSGGGSKNEREEGPSTFVTHVAFSADGSSMATVDVRSAEQEIGGGACLKFWDRQPGKLQYIVNTQVDEPHDISALSFHPQELMAVSCSNMDFKVWVPSGRRKPTRFSWRCRSVGSYRQKPMLAAAFSPDGSVLAVAASELVTLWNPSTNGLVRVLSNSVPSQPINHLAFVNHSTCLVAASSGERPLLTLWDLSTLSVRWSHSMRVQALAVDPARASFAVLAGISSAPKNKGVESKNAVLALFGADSPAPLRYWTIRDGVGGTVLFYPDLPSSAGAPPAIQADESKSSGLELARASVKSRLAVITKGREFALFNPYEDEEEPEQLVVKDTQVSDPTISSAFTAIYGKAVKPKKKETSSDMLNSLGAAPWGTLLEGPSHVLPPLSVMCIPFMESLLKKRSDK